MFITFHTLIFVTSPYQYFSGGMLPFVIGCMLCLAQYLKACMWNQTRAFVGKNTGKD